jgi:hypothetical protein
VGEGGKARRQTNKSLGQARRQGQASPSLSPQASKDAYNVFALFVHVGERHVHRHCGRGAGLQHPRPFSWGGKGEPPRGQFGTKFGTTNPPNGRGG